ncbi:MAG: M48 family metalloprotease [Deltaproteobacteria bacterium]|nr:M48 family metalloprotease [Deltaproteobacteria bacterium]
MASGDFRQRASQGEESFSEEDDVRAEVVFGRGLAARILGKYAFYENDKLNEYVNKIGKGLAQFANRPEIEFRFAVLDTDIVNAYAAPGGYIFVTKGALRQMEDEAELAAVLSHEIAHVTERHIVKELNIKGTEVSPVSGFAQVLGGGSGAVRTAFTQMVDKAAEILFEKGLKKEDEYDSDRVATMTIATAGYDPSALKRYLKKISNSAKETKTLTDTHPSFDERIKNVDNVLAENQLTDKKQALVKGRFNENVRIK